MPYTIIYMNNAREVGRETWTGKLAEAQAFVDDVVGTKQYERIEIRDDAGELVYQRPRVMRPLDPPTRPSAK